MTRKIRYEIILPLFFNDGTGVPAELFEITTREIINAFGGCSVHACSEGLWRDGGVTFRDQNRTLVVDVSEDTDVAAFEAIRDTLKERFKQQCIYIVRYPIEVL